MISAGESLLSIMLCSYKEPVEMNMWHLSSLDPGNDLILVLRT